MFRKIKTYILCLIFLFLEILLFMIQDDKVQNYCGAGEATDDNVVHVHYIRLQKNPQNM
jgi:hypothetical protein